MVQRFSRANAQLLNPGHHLSPSDNDKFPAIQISTGRRPMVCMQIPSAAFVVCELSLQMRWHRSCD
jgi:hypothetical protein